MDAITIILMIIVGILAGAITGLMGASGVIVVVPLLELLFNFTIYDAIGTSLFVNVVAALAVAFVYRRNRNVDMRSGIWLAGAALIGAQVGAVFAAGIPAAGLGGSFGVFLIIMGIAVWQRGFNREAIAKRFEGVRRFKTRNQQRLFALAVGFIIGIMSGIFGAGGGIMILLALLFILDFPLLVAIGTSTLIMATTAASATLGYALQGNIVISAGIIISIGTIIGGVPTALFANRVNEKILSKAIGATFLGLGVLMTALRFVG